jgi:hypothetical protein
MTRLFIIEGARLPTTLDINFTLKKYTMLCPCMQIDSPPHFKSISSMISRWYSAARASLSAALLTYSTQVPPCTSTQLKSTHCVCPLRARGKLSPQARLSGALKGSVPSRSLEEEIHRRPSLLHRKCGVCRQHVDECTCWAAHGS